jgi:uncharacterized protein YegJ (DUF2314 family)
MSPSRRPLHHGIAALLASLAVLACTQALTGCAQKYGLAGLQAEEPALRQAAEMAQATLNDFLTKAKLQPAGTSAYALRVRIEDGRDIEYFWLEEFTWSDGSFTGKINNEPRLLKGIQRGQTVRFTRAQVTDWKYRDDRTATTFGHFEACARLRKEPSAQAQEIQRREGLACR